MQEKIWRIGIPSVDIDNVPQLTRDILLKKV
jgi:hypothetical protein